MQPNIQIKITDSRINDFMPSYATPGSAAIDLRACISEPLVLQPGQSQLISAGFSLNMHSQQMAGLIVPRSGMGHKLGLVLSNGTGLIDPDYMGEIMVGALNRSDKPLTIQPMDRIAQMYFTPILKPLFEVVDAFATSTNRGEGGFGSTGTV